MRNSGGRNVTLALAVALLLGVFAPTYAECLPTSGIFRGIYHRDRFGDRRFLFFEIPESLQAAFDVYEGKYIEVEVTKGEQSMNPGNVTLLAIGKITQLPAAKVAITASIVPENVTGEAPFQVLVRVRNLDDKVLELCPGIHLLLRSDPAATGAGDGWRYPYGAFSWHSRNPVASPLWRRHHILGHPADQATRIRLAPGETMPWAVVFDEGLGAGRYELEASIRLGDSEPVPVAAWASLDVGTGMQAPRETSTALRLTHSLGEPDAEWVSMQLCLSNEGVDRRAIPECLDRGTATLWAGRLRGYTDDGMELPLTFDYPLHNAMGPPEGAWQIIDIPRDGLRMSMRFRPESWFPPAPLKRVTCEILTDSGLESFTITDAFQDTVFSPPPPFGEVKHGVKCRIRTHKQTYARDESIRIYWQVANIDQVAVVFRSDDGWRVTVDGKDVLSPYDGGVVWGWALPRGPYAPDEHYIDLGHLKLAPGRHSVQLVCRGSGPSHYKNANGELIPVFKGSLRSNSTGFVVEQD